MMAQAHEPNDRLDRLVKVWQRVGGYLEVRPLQVVLALVACGIVILVLGLTLAASQARTDIDQIQDALCNAPGETYSAARKAQCQTLLSNLLKNPTPEQKQRLRAIVKGTP